jgi:hypothetical protein
LSRNLTRPRDPGNRDAAAVVARASVNSTLGPSAPWARVAGRFAGAGVHYVYESLSLIAGVFLLFDRPRANA